MKNKLGGHLEFTKDLQLYGVISQLIEAEVSSGSFQLGILTRHDEDSDEEQADLDKDNAKYARRLAETHEKDLKDLIVMAPEGGNLSDLDEEEGSFFSTISDYVDDLTVMNEIGLTYYNINPGRVEETHSELLDDEVKNLFYEDHIKEDLTAEDLMDDAIEQLVTGIDEIHDNTEGQSTVILVDLNVYSETGNNVCHTFEHLKKVIDGVEDKRRIGVSLDTCKLYAAGYDIVEELDEVIQKFDEIVGLQYLKALHISDSKAELGSNVKKRAAIGEGLIGQDALEDFVKEDRFKDIPKVLNTPNGKKHFSK